MTAKIHEAIYSSSHQCSKNQSKQIVQAKDKEEDEMSINIEELLNKSMKMVYGEKSEKVRDKIVNAYTATYGKAVEKGYGKGFFEVEWGGPDWEKIHHLQTSTYEFSSAKWNEQLQALNHAMVDPNTGKMIPFNEFKEIAKRINNEMAIRHLKTEYNTAEASAQIAAKWTRFEKDKDVYPNIMFVTAGDDRVRDSHAALDGVVRPIDDPFWDENTPPLSWNCRCDIRQAVGGRRITPEEKIAYPEDTPPLFRRNFAKEGMAFPPDHPYYQHLPQEVKEQTKGKNPFEYEKFHTGKKGGYVWKSVIGDKNGVDDADLMAKLLANDGDKIIFLPEINPSSDNPKFKKVLQILRELCLPENIASKSHNPDAWVNMQFSLDFKGVDSEKSVLNHISTKDPQADIFCFRFKNKIDEEKLMRTLKGKLKHDKDNNVKEIWYMKGRKIQKFTKDEIMNYQFKSKKP